MAGPKIVHAEFMRLHELGMNSEQMAPILGVSPGGIRGYRRRHGIDPFVGSPEFQGRYMFTDSQLMETYEAGLTAQEAADQLGCKVKTVHVRAKQVGIKFKRPPQTNQGAREARYRELHESGMHPTDIALTLGMTPAGARRLRRRLGLPGGTARQPRVPRDPKYDISEEWVRDAYARGLSTKEAAAEIGVSTSVVNERRVRYGVPRFRVDIQEGARGPARKLVDRDLVRVHTEGGLNCKQIAERLGCSEGTVSRIRTELGINVVSQPALEMLEGGASYQDVSTTLGVDYEAVRRWHPGMGWQREQVYEYRTMKQVLERLDGRPKTGLDWR